MIELPPLPGVPTVSMMDLPVSTLVSDPRYQVRTSTSAKTADRYSRVYRKSKRRTDTMGHITVFLIDLVPYVVDGHHRLAAAEKAGIPEIRCEVHEDQTHRDAIKFVCGSNLQHGLSRRAEDTRRAVFLYLDTFPFDPQSLPSIRDVAKVCGLKSRRAVTRYYAEWRRRNGIEEEGETFVVEAENHIEREAGDDGYEEEATDDEVVHCTTRPDAHTTKPTPTKKPGQEHLKRGPDPEALPNYPILAQVDADKRPLIHADAAFYRDMGSIREAISECLHRHERTARNGVYFQRVKWMLRWLHPKDWQPCNCGDELNCKCRGTGYKV